VAVVGTGTTKKGTGKMKKVGDSWDFLGRGESPIPPTIRLCQSKAAIGCRGVAQRAKADENHTPAFGHPSREGNYKKKKMKRMQI